jgi:hypothetical protein
MPFKSESQHRKFRVLLAQGKISQSKFDEWMDETKRKSKNKNHPIKALPEKVAVIEKTAFWSGFEKAAEFGDGGSGFTGTGKGVIQGGLISNEKDGPVSRSKPGGDETLATKDFRDRERGPKSYGTFDMGPDYADDNNPHIIK